MSGRRGGSFRSSRARASSTTDRARPLQDRRHAAVAGSSRSGVRPGASRQRDRRHRLRSRGRLRRASGPSSRRRPPTEVALALLPATRIPARGATRRLPRAHSGDDRRLHRLVPRPQLTNVEDGISRKLILGVPLFLAGGAPLRARRPAVRSITDDLERHRYLLAGHSDHSVAVIVILLISSPIFTYVPRVPSAHSEHDVYPPWQAPVMIARAGLRGAVARRSARLPQGRI